jgi:hypothetical protein
MGEGKGQGKLSNADFGLRNERQKATARGIPPAVRGEGNNGIPPQCGGAQARGVLPGFIFDYAVAGRIRLDGPRGGRHHACGRGYHRRRAADG